jgi:hypothetical protein
MSLEFDGGYLVPDTTPAPATPDLDDLLSNLPGFSLLSPGMKNAALAGAQIPDENSVWPGQTGYIPTYDTYFAALNLMGFLMAQPVVRQTSSEGTSVAVDAPNWGALSAYYRGMSVIVQATGNGILQMVTIPDVPHVQRTNMRMEAYGNDNVDTDLD